MEKSPKTAWVVGGIYEIVNIKFLWFNTLLTNDPSYNQNFLKFFPVFKTPFIFQKFLRAFLFYIIILLLYIEINKYIRRIQY